MIKIEREKKRDHTTYREPSEMIRDVDVTSSNRRGYFDSTDAVELRGDVLKENDTIFNADIRSQYPSPYQITSVGTFTDENSDEVTDAIRINNKGSIVIHEIHTLKEWFIHKEDAIARMDKLKTLNSVAKSTFTVTISDELMTKVYAELNNDERIDDFKDAGLGNTRDGLFQELLAGYLDGRV